MENKAKKPNFIKLAIYLVLFLAFGAISRFV